ncbi:hypothetical protein EIN_038250 [Entamoeba invadens IP1]|uniref:Leucine rich repeat containing protein BspA family protein n=1 Tax=Entamoeba invadens IP1 TaxID=370355 RepID=L7FNW3_ENTIV|nr:hypothetical protein EIN_038250 [Entamoeba invadens IP1]ELP94675.1 hypothetical protein EIN_038250 [Entamoeba invadens IP1]|eukprot:XP_004261446.1 hypothetical protein EIN_038250 [Entamoeba invadens IP1]
MSTLYCCNIIKVANYFTSYLDYLNLEMVCHKFRGFYVNTKINPLPNDYKMVKLFDNLRLNTLQGDSYIQSINSPVGITNSEKIPFQKLEMVKFNPFEYTLNDCNNKIFITRNITVIGENCFKNIKTLLLVTYSSPQTTTSDYEKMDFNCLKYILLPNNVSVIKNCCFRECEYLREVDLPKSLLTIGDFCFENCYELSSITFGLKVTSLGKSAFHNCKKLIQLNLPKSLNVIESSCFIGCDGLDTLVIPQSVKEIRESCFKKCSQLSFVYLPEGTTKIEKEAFRNCKSLKYVVIENMQMEIGNKAFSDCHNDFVLKNKLTKLIKSLKRYNRKIYTFDVEDYIHPQK